ncbi:MAG: hypothetical protein ACFFKA_13975 [Candidatus Thorarchaeota archaeon]
MDNKEFNQNKYLLDMQSRLLDEELYHASNEIAILLIKVEIQKQFQSVSVEKLKPFRKGNECLYKFEE